MATIGERDALMRYGTMNFPVKPVVAEINAAATMGMDFIELAMDPPQAHFSQIKANQRAITRALKHNRLGLICHLPTFVYSAHLADSIRNASIQEILGALEMAADLGAEKAVVHPGYIDGLAVYVMDDALQRAMDSLERFARRAESLGMALCIENMFPGLGPFFSPDDFEMVFRHFPRLNLVLDTGHAHIGDGSGRRIIDFISRFGHRLAHVHVSDNMGQSDDHWPIGQGTIAFEQVAQALRSVGYDDTITMEIFSQDRGAIQSSRRVLEQLLKV